MDIKGAAIIKSISTRDSGGGVLIDIIELADGWVIGATEETVVLYDSVDDLFEGDPSLERPHIYL